ncbi:glutaminyl-peptide cyclotransferase [Spongiivirga citrea]|uniref:Glutaminyl-peptide cyclotransferase n=1 Tax=Spongiivirga citrea TaxID=1481457 RepID=A0A6M0CNS1_9FLAO|nr:glutaminyl-peptide cyclotransferase [Spongiivirga citrea]NER17519.1 glutaminyl-peptide cyclotransferase [Spongiivirga citrea]
MKFFKIGSVLLFIGLFLSCNGGKNANASNFNIQLLTKKKRLNSSDVLNFKLLNKNAIEVDSISYKIEGDTNEQQTTAGEFELSLANASLGKHTIVFSVHHDDTVELVRLPISIFSDIKPKVYGYKIINEYPHDIKAFTQGLEFKGDTLYESTGKRGESSIRKVEVKSGAVTNKVDLAANHFGEGITIMNNQLYALTWQAGIGFVYDPETLEKKSSFQYGQSKEGWGFCNDGTTLYKSDGTAHIWRLNPDTLIEEGSIQVCTNTKILKDINELEWVDGKIYANTWQSNREVAVIINPKNGAVEGVINFGGLKEKVSQHPELDVLNGIAYHPEKKTLFVTGKYWDKLFEVELVEK